MEHLAGLIIKAQSGFFWVATAQGDYVCRLRGRLKQARRPTDLAAVGDRVTVSVQADGTGMIEHIEPRARVLSRRASSGLGRGTARSESQVREQVLVANPDQVLLVFACAQPEPRPRMLDRYLVATERHKLPAIICANKADLVPPERPLELFGLYARLGYPVLVLSAATGQGIEDLRAVLRGKLSVLSGPSGVGKSSLLNALQPGLGLRAREVSAATTKGRHTTVFSELLPVEGGYVADTPGIRSLGLWDIQPEELDAYFVEIGPLVDQCEFSDCSHRLEPGCAVRAAVDEGRVARSRYESYLRLRVDQALGEE
jgi:ribosome biogenesis GTPase